MRKRVFPYKRGSASAKRLAEALGALRLRREGSGFWARPGDVVVNWGACDLPPALKAATVFNSPDSVYIVSNKLRFFLRVSEEHSELLPKFWLSRDEIPADEYPIVCRTVLNGHSGMGIVVADTADDLVAAPLYVKYVNTTDEYRVHVGRTPDRKNPERIVAVQRKARKRSVPDSEVNWRVRNHANGFVFVRNGISPPVCVLDAARLVFETTGLDFGAADVVYSGQDDRAYVLEINSAPGLEGTTVGDYVQYFRGRGVV